MYVPTYCMPFMQIKGLLKLWYRDIIHNLRKCSLNKMYHWGSIHNIIYNTAKKKKTLNSVAQSKIKTRLTPVLDLVLVLLQESRKFCCYKNCQ